MKPNETYIQFNDGVSIKTSGPYRTLRRRDGYYVVGRGACIPVASYEEAQTVIQNMEDPNGGK